MHLGVNLSNALQQLESVKTAVDQSDDPKLKAATNDDLNLLINLLESPILKSIATLHDSVGLLATQVAHHPSILPGDFDITPAGDLALQTRNLYGAHEGEEEQRVPQVSPPHSLEFGSGSETEHILGLDSASVDSNMSPKQTRGLLEISRNDDSLVSASTNIVAGDWAQVEIINLVNDGTGLGFGIIGARTSGVIVKTILAGGVADRDGRLKSGDHILQIGDVSLMEMGSEQVAGVLRASGSRVRLVVARAVDPAAVHASNAPVVPARLLSSPEALDRYLLEAGFEQVFHTQPTPLALNSNVSRFVFDASITPPPESDAESPEVDRFTVQLKKDENGLGITIAGYVCEKEELSGIFVKSVTPGSAAALSGKVRVNDRIVAVDGVSLAGKSNQRAVDALKQSGNIVTLELERYLRGPKFEQLQQAIAAGESAASAHNPFLHMHRPEPGAHQDHDIQMTHLQSPLESTVEESEPSPPRSPLPPPSARAAPHFEMPRTQEQKDAIKKKWQAILGDEVEIVVGVVVRGGGGLGISLEGTVDVEGGREVRPHHYVRSVLPEGPVGRAGVHRPGDELLEVNGHRLLGMNHLEVVSILKELSSEVCMVCARPRPAPPLDLAPPAATLVKRSVHGVRSAATRAAAGPGAARCHSCEGTVLHRGERAPAVGHEPPGGGLHSQGAVQRSVHGVRSAATRAAAGPGAARCHSCEGEVGREPSGRRRRGGWGPRRGGQGALAQPRAAHWSRHVVVRAADYRTGKGRARSRLLDSRLPGPAASVAHARGDPLAGAGRRGAAGRPAHTRRPAAVRQRSEFGEREPGASGGSSEGCSSRRGAHRRGQTATAGRRAAPAARLRSPRALHARLTRQVLTTYTT